jgi:hypothetical protein
MTDTKKQSSVSGPGSRQLKRKKCLVKDCVNDARFRGCCINCLAVFRRAVAAKKTTWKKLIAAGLVLEPNPGKKNHATQEVERLINQGR